MIGIKIKEFKPYKPKLLINKESSLKDMCMREFGAVDGESQFRARLERLRQIIGQSRKGRK
jgi:hypothetical protein